MGNEMAAVETAFEDDFATYRAVSKAAVISLALGIVSLVGLLSPTLLVLALVGGVLGVVAVCGISRYPNELTGKPIAMIGIALCTFVFVGGAARHSYIYATEVPEGHMRISFADLQPDKNRPNMPIPPAALELDGKKVFIKGYLYPGDQQYNIQRFILIPDLGTCCFGGQPKLTDMIEVTLEDPLRIEYSLKKRKLAGVLDVDTQIKPVSDLGGVYYRLTADYVK